MGRRKDGKNKKGRGKKATARRRKDGGMAASADPHVLYEASVQNVDDEVEFLTGTFRDVRGRDAVRLREDFCGTGAAACAWIRAAASHEAVGVDIDPEVLSWGRANHVARLTDDQRRRLTLIEGNVLDADTSPPADIVVAFNFSYWTFKTREQMRRYFTAVRRAMQPDGLFFLDVYGGCDAYDEMKEKTRYDGFTYVWDQASFDPVSGLCQCYIHFRFPDGSRLNRAFSYEWRVWSIPELRELLDEAGFSSSTVYWQGTDEDGDGNGIFTPVEKGEADPAWIAYIVASP